LHRHAVQQWVIGNVETRLVTTEVGSVPEPELLSRLPLPPGDSLLDELEVLKVYLGVVRASCDGVTSLRSEFFQPFSTRSPPVLSCVWSRLYCQASRFGDWGARAWKRRPIWLHQPSLEKLNVNDTNAEELTEKW